jgi:flagellar basal-body rod modification protein FlgD
MPANLSPVTNVTRTEAETGASGMLSKDAFLKILVAQMSHPDPFAPQDPGAFISEMSQMAVVEQMISLSNKMEAVYRLAALSQAASLIGRQVVVADGEETVAGEVAKVVLNDGKVTIVINGKPYDSGNLVEVR